MRSNLYVRGAFALLAIITSPCWRTVAAQTDYYNTDAGRPIRIEDARPIERRAVELQFAPLRLERARGGIYHWGLEPQAAFGILPRTQVEVGVPLAFIDGGATRRSGIAGLELSALHNLNVETSLPALAISADVLLPVGNLAPDRAFASVKGIATRTLTWARFHVNGEYTFGEESGLGTTTVADVSRWLGGIAVDRTFPLRSMLLTAEVVAEQPIHSAEDVEWSTGAGVRYQYSPRWALDAGLGKRVSGSEQPWFVTFGSAYAFGLPWRAR